MKHLLDTNICVFVIRQKPQRVLDRLHKCDPDDLAISTVTLAELRYGADKSQDPAKNHNALSLFLAPLEIVEFDARAAEEYGSVRLNLEARLANRSARHDDRRSCFELGCYCRDKQCERVRACSWVNG